MMYERPPTTPFQNPPRNTTFPFQRYTLVFQQHQDEPIYDAWTRFKNLIKRVPHHGLDLWSLTQFFYDHVDDYTRMDLDFAADGNLRELSGEEAWEAIENFAQGQKEWDNPPNIISEQEVANLKAQAKRLFGNEDVWVEMHRGIAWDKVENSDPQKEVEKTLGTPIEVEPLNETKLEEVGLNCNHNTPLSSREVPSFDGPEPQPLLNSPSLDVSLGDVIGPEPPIKPHSLDSSRMRIVDYLTTQTPPSPHVENSRPKGMYSYCNPEMFDGDWGLESKEVSPLGEELSLFDRPNELERGRILEAQHLGSIIQQPIFQHVTPSYNNGVYHYYHPHLNSSVGEPSPLSVK
ncbi:hypothetical protein Tco_1350008 [Tanacetum coccineum]